MFQRNKYFYHDYNILLFIMLSLLDYRISFLFLWVQSAKCMSLKNQHSYFMDNSGPESDVADIIVSKGYIPSEKELPKTSIVKNIDNDVTYLLSKLSDEELIKLLNDQPQKAVYDLNDIVKVAVGSDAIGAPRESKLPPDWDIDTKKARLQERQYQNDKKRFKTVSEKDKPQAQAYFRLENKPVEPLQHNFNSKDTDPENSALQTLNNLLYSSPQDVPQSEDEEDAKKELLFDVLVAQLKTLCCKRKRTAKKPDPKKFQLQYQSLMNQLLPQQDKSLNNHKLMAPSAKSKPLGNYEKAPNEFMFLIINDEIKTNASEELISVDPESLDQNSSVLLLGPITTPLTDIQLKVVMKRISNELGKPDYLPLLQQLSDGSLSDSNIRLMKSLVTGPETRRYIKPHRCNHQAPLAKVYGGPKWIICTGYLNLNTPSLYD